MGRCCWCRWFECCTKCETNERVSRVLDLNYARWESMRMTNCWCDWECLEMIVCVRCGLYVRHAWYVCTTCLVCTLRTVCVTCAVRAPWYVRCVLHVLYVRYQHYTPLTEGSSISIAGKKNKGSVSVLRFPVLPIKGYRTVVWVLWSS